MALPSWPSEVPTAPRDGWQFDSMYLAPLVSEMEGGNQRLRAQPGGNVAVISYPLRPLTVAEWTALNTFVRTTLSNGTSRFTMSLWTGTAFETKTVQFEKGQSPKAVLHDTYMHVTLPLRVYGM